MPTDDWQALRRQALDDLQASQRRISEQLKSAASDQNWQPAPDEWTFREVAAHMATVEEECFLDRFTRIAADGEPHFAYYSNTGRDFGDTDLEAWLEAWAATRSRIVRLVEGFDESQWAYTATHEKAGQVNVPWLLQSILDHDAEHDAELQETIATYQQSR